MEHLTNTNFDSFVKSSDKPVIVDFWATWCGPCKMMGPVLEEIESERDDVVIAKVNVDDAPELAAKFGIMSIPAFIVFRNGEPDGSTVGYMPADALLSELGL